jgi:hypothetical protein
MTLKQEFQEEKEELGVRASRGSHPGAAMAKNSVYRTAILRYL